MDPIKDKDTSVDTSFHVDDVGGYGAPVPCDNDDDDNSDETES